MQEFLNRQAGECVLQAFGTFLEENTTKLEGLKDKLGVYTESDLNLLSLRLHPTENTTILNLVDTENKIINKIVVVFTALCLEVRELEKDFLDNYIDQIIFFGEGSSETSIQEHEALLLISDFLPTLCNLQVLIKRCHLVFQHLIHQLGAFYDIAQWQSKSLSPFRSHLPDAMEHMGRLLLILLTIDECLEQNETFGQYWAAYQSLLSSTYVITKFQPQKLDLIRDMTLSLNKTVCSGRAFLDALVPFEGRNRVADKYKDFFAEFDMYLKNTVSEIRGCMSRPADPDMGNKWSRTVCLLVANMKINNGGYNFSWRNHKTIFEILKWIPLVTLYGCVSWFPDKFLRKHDSLQYLERGIESEKATQAYLTFLRERTTYLDTRLPYLSFRVLNWVLEMETAMRRDWTSFSADDLKTMPDLFFFGVRYSSKLKVLVTDVTNLYGVLGQPMGPSTVLNICRVVELIKTLRHTFIRHKFTVARTVHHVIQRCNYRLLEFLNKFKIKLTKEKTLRDKYVDVLSAVMIAERSLDGPSTATRLLIVRIALSLANQDNIFTKDEITKLKLTLNTLMKLSSLMNVVEEASDCRFLYWQRVILPIYFTNTLSIKTYINRIKYVLEGLTDCAESKRLPVHKAIIHILHTEIIEQLDNKIMKPLSVSIENNLRLHAHAHLQDQDVLPSLSADTDIKHVLHIPPFFFFDQLIHVRGKVENYLERTFYDLTTVALHDWRTYGEMRVLADHKFNLSTVEDNLPSQTLDQGLDVLEIMRGIPQFVQNYQYNLYNQIFIEASSNSKHLNTINIKHIANSIRNHGTGFMNTTVNFTYQFLKEKLVIVSQFLFDEQIKSRLLKDLQYFRENKAELDSKYPYGKAERFNINIRKLGLKKDLSYLDQFRIVITQIGNAMGYIRMLRSGALHYISNAACYIPDLDNIVNLQELTEEEEMSSVTVDTAKVLDKVIQNIVSNVSGSVEYIQKLVSAVAPALRDPKNTHLKNFCVIVPPLIVNYCESIVLAKDKMLKKSREGAAFTDDGFAMGVAYLLSAIGIDTEFDSLHFFDSIKDKFESELKSVAEQQQKISRDDQKLEQTLNLTAKRLHTFNQEYELLFYSLSSARVFFRKEFKKPVPESEAANVNLQ